MTTKRSGPGKAFRRGISLVQAVHKCGDERKAAAWFVARARHWLQRIAAAP